jgi:protein-S-isoprenylcysteine O-methyltransferase Ste14
LLASTLFFLRDFGEHIYAHFTGSIFGKTIMGQWHIVILHIAFFVAFMVPLSYRRRVDCKECGLVTAFFVSLFVEMYGIPFTMLLVARAIGSSNQIVLNRVAAIELFGTKLAATIPMVYGAVLMVVGGSLILLGWITLYRNVKKANLVTCGIYSFSRHPQYMGFILIVIGWVVGWPTVLTLIFAPILIYKYVMLCLQEEKELLKWHDYLDYKKRVPFLV